MDSNGNKKARTLENSKRFFDYMEWVGRVPSTRSSDEYERKLAFWLVHMKQAKKGFGTCIWYEELLEDARNHGVPDIFDVDSRTVHYFESFQGSVIGPFKVLGLDDIRSPYGQNLWICSDQSDKCIKVSTFILLRLISNADYINLINKMREFSGKEIGPWRLLGVLGLEGANDTAWMCSRKNGKYNEVQRVVLPSFKALSRFFSVMGNKPVDPVVDSSLGHGVEDMTGKRCNSWTVVGYSHKAVNNECMWSCVCDCGNTSKVAGGKLRNGSSRSCGCYRKKVAERELPVSQEVASA